MEHISQHWNVATVGLSYLIAVTGSFCTIQLMEQWRQYETAGMKLVLMVLSAVTLAGCGIWCTHFTGMNSLELVLDDGTKLEIHFEVGLTVLSFIFPVVGVFVGLKIASTDPFFLEVEATRRKNMMVKVLKNTSMRDVVNKKMVARSIKYTALFGRLWRILGGGIFAALGVLGMHYLGMSAQRTNADMQLHAGVVVLSCVIAFVTANAAFWILFRAHTFWPEHDGLRVASALIMGLAVCGTHYCGMGAATYVHTGENYTERTRFTISGSKTSIVASHAAILLCYWLTSLGLIRSVKITQSLTRSRADDRRSSLAPKNIQVKSEYGRVTRVPLAQPTAVASGSSRAKIYATGGSTEQQSSA